MEQDHYLFLEPDQAVYVVTKCKDGYEVFRMYVDKNLGTCSALVENLSDEYAADLQKDGGTLIDGYRKKKASREANPVEKSVFSSRP
jgi:hypothetical protein